MTAMRIAHRLRALVRAGLDTTSRMPLPMLLLLVPLLAVLAYGSGTVLLDALTAMVTAVAQLAKALFWLAALAVTARLLHRLINQHLHTSPPASSHQEPAA
ncbi:hypothetical protein ACOMD4_37790 [Streptomyces anulatus]|uniref:hypothetical protein n=1 Tax=Streptomyces anulatus TaxID=1892 RepID=UPI003B79BD63